MGVLGFGPGALTDRPPKAHPCPPLEPRVLPQPRIVPPAPNAPETALERAPSLCGVSGTGHAAVTTGNHTCQAI